MYDEWRFLLNQDQISDSELADKVAHILKEKEMKLPMRTRDELRSMVEAQYKKICNPALEQNVRGDVEMIIDYKSGKREVHEMKNTILDAGKAALAASLTNNINDPYDFYISNMIFGTNGTTGDGVTMRYIDSGRTGLFGTTVLNNPVLASVSSGSPATAVFTSIIGYDQVNGLALSEMALVMANGSLYSMISFPSLNKMIGQQITINWTISVL